MELICSNARYFAGSMLFAAVNVLVGFTTPIFLGEIIDSVLGTKPSTLPEFLLNPIRQLGGREFLISHLWILGAVYVLLFLISGTANYFKGRWTATASENIALTLRESLYNHLQKLPFAYHVKAEPGELIQRCTSDVETVRRFLSGQIMEIVNTLLMVAIALTILLGKNVRLTMLSMMLVPLLFAFATWFTGMVHKHFRISDAAEGKMSAVLQENLTGVRVVRAFGQQEREVEKFDEVSGEYRKKSQVLNNLLAVYWGVGDGITLTQMLTTLMVCVFAAISGEITVGTMIVFTSYANKLLFPIRQLGRILSDAGKSMVAMERMLKILHEEPEQEEPESVKPDLHGDIVFDHVSFEYSDDHMPVLRDVSCTIPGGKTVAILGSTGSGKSTMVHLLQRLYEPTSGKITIGGVDLTSINREYLRSHVGLILQEPFLYSRSIYENVGIVMPKILREKVTHAADVADASGFIAGSEKGYDTVVGERGVTLSGGQKQRIAIARTLIKDNSILIFDDSLSAVDTETDAQIRAALKHEFGNVTTIIISHRITTLSQADLILTLEDGTITQQGTHQQLIHQEGLYRRINAIQSDLENELMEETLGKEAK